MSTPLPRTPLSSQRTTPPSEAAPLTRREWALVMAFWAGWALLSVGNRVLDPIGPAEQVTRIGGAVAVAIIEAVCWILLTPPLFQLTTRLGVAPTPWPVRLGVFGGGGILVALALSVLGSVVRHALDPHGGSPGPPPSGPATGSGPPLWFGFLNALVLYVGVLAAGLARAYSRRYRTRDSQAVRLQAALADARRECALLERYVDIMQVRFQGRLTV